MSVIYNVTIEPTAKENIFQVTWQNEETGKANSFESTPEITTGETRRLWQNTEFQLPIGQKLFRFLDGETQNFRRAMKKAKGKSENLQLHLNTCRETHDWPFELLAKDGTFLLSHRLHLVRNVSDCGKEKRNHPKDRP